MFTRCDNAIMARLAISHYLLVIYGTDGSPVLYEMTGFASVSRINMVCIFSTCYYAVMAGHAVITGYIGVVKVSIPAIGTVTEITGAVRGYMSGTFTNNDYSVVATVTFLMTENTVINHHCRTKTTRLMTRIAVSRRFYMICRLSNGVYIIVTPRACGG